MAKGLSGTGSSYRTHPHPARYSSAMPLRLYWTCSDFSADSNYVAECVHRSCAGSTHRDSCPRFAGSFGESAPACSSFHCAPRFCVGCASRCRIGSPPCRCIGRIARRCAALASSFGSFRCALQGQRRLSAGSSRSPGRSSSQGPPPRSSANGFASQPPTCLYAFASQGFARVAYAPE